MNDRIAEVTRPIAAGSRDSRPRYLDRVAAAAADRAGRPRARLGCANAVRRADSGVAVL